MANVLDTYALFNINMPEIKEALPPTKVECFVKNRSIIFEIDIRAPYALIPLRTYNSMKKYFPPPEPTEVKQNPIQSIQLMLWA